jgi:hypothetical protein
MFCTEILMLPGPGFPDKEIDPKPRPPERPGQG